MDFKDKVKDVWEKAGDVAEKTYKTVADKSNRLVEEAKLNTLFNTPVSNNTESFMLALIFVTVMCSHEYLRF